ncbi:MAG: rhomboid family intramembrane serine protease [Candidatus Lokiarchaeota archaeon]|nr:rhomboid family intramembrane serine protease [Candidatus Harpocratesius repetitus]
MAIEISEESMKNAHFTFSLIIINILIFIIVNLISGSNVVLFLAQSNHLIVHGQELWGLFTSMFIHADAAHLIFNMISLFIFGIFVENNYPKWQFLLVYLISGLIGSVFSFLYYLIISQGIYYPIYGLGSSGAIYGLMAAAFVKIPRSNYYMYIFGIIFVLYRILSSLDNWAHIFGFVSGFLMARIFVHQKYHNLSRFQKKTENYGEEFRKEEPKSSERKIFNRFCIILQINNPISINIMANYLQLTEMDLMKRLVVWKERLPFLIKRNKIIIPNMDEFLLALERFPS